MPGLPPQRPLAPSAHPACSEGRNPWAFLPARAGRALRPRATARADAAPGLGRINFAAASLSCAPLAAKSRFAPLMQQAADITVVVTSCNRHDLLARTLESFRAHETEGRVARILVAEDGEADPSEVCARFGAEHFRTGERVGQIKLIDQAYAKVTTPLIFHLEDDWEFTRSGFMERSRHFLELDPKILLVQLRPWNDNNG